VKKEIPIGSGMVTRKAPIPLPVSNKVEAINGDYLKNASTARFTITPV
jgi:hypothetical protein